MSIDLLDCHIEAKRTGSWRPRWDVKVVHLPTSIIGHGLQAKSYEDGRDGAVRRIESLLQASKDRP